MSYGTRQFAAQFGGVASQIREISPPSSYEDLVEINDLATAAAVFGENFFDALAELDDINDMKTALVRFATLTAESAKVESLVVE